MSISRCDDMCMLVSLDTDVFEIAKIWVFEHRELALIINERGYDGNNNRQNSAGGEIASKNTYGSR
jgi:hypothetical protein